MDEAEEEIGGGRGGSMVEVGVEVQVDVSPSATSHTSEWIEWIE